MSTTEATHLFTPVELQRITGQAQAYVDMGHNDAASVAAQLAQAKANAEIAYQLAKLNRLLENAVDENTGCFVIRHLEL